MDDIYPSPTARDGSSARTDNTQVKSAGNVASSSARTNMNTQCNSNYTNSVFDVNVSDNLLATITSDVCGVFSPATENLNEYSQPAVSNCHPTIVINAKNKSPTCVGNIEDFSAVEDHNDSNSSFLSGACSISRKQAPNKTNKIDDFAERTCHVNCLPTSTDSINKSAGTSNLRYRVSSTSSVNNSTANTCYITDHPTSTTGVGNSTADGRNIDHRTDTTSSISISVANTGNINDHQTSIHDINRAEDDPVASTGSHWPAEAMASQAMGMVRRDVFSYLPALDLLRCRR